MSDIDYTKLAPWRISENKRDYAVESWETLVLGERERVIARFNDRADAEAACLLRAAADVQQRRKWTVLRWNDGTWGVVNADHGYSIEALDDMPDYACEKDPALALVLADRWLTAHEAKGE